MPTTTFGIDDLTRILQEGAGGELAGDITDVPFEDLGYDSLALMETGSRIGRELGFELADEALVDIDTPRDLLVVVNAALLERTS